MADKQVLAPLVDTPARLDKTPETTQDKYLTQYVANMLQGNIRHDLKSVCLLISVDLNLQVSTIYQNEEGTIYRMPWAC